MDRFEVHFYLNKVMKRKPSNELAKLEGPIQDIHSQEEKIKEIEDKIFGISLRRNAHVRYFLK